MADSAIETIGLTKRYGTRRGIENLTFSVPRGDVFGFLGPNGAGKTTTIRTLLDMIRPTSGRARVLGLDSRASTLEIHRRTGYLPGELSLNERDTGAEQIRFISALRGGVDQAVIRSYAERLDADLKEPIGDLSHGNKRKIGLIIAFMHQPELLVLDEPTLGIDPLVQLEFRRMVHEAAQRGATVFLSSHVLSEVEHTCDRVGIIREGTLVTVDDIGSMKARARRRVEIHFAHPVSAEPFARVPGVTDIEVNGDTLRCTVAGSVDALVKATVQYTVVDFTTHEPSLEDVFLDYYKGGAHGSNAAPKDAA